MPYLPSSPQDDPVAAPTDDGSRPLRLTELSPVPRFPNEEYQHLYDTFNGSWMTAPPPDARRNDTQTSGNDTVIATSTSHQPSTERGSHHTRRRLTRLPSSQGETRVIFARSRTSPSGYDIFVSVPRPENTERQLCLFVRDPIETDENEWMVTVTANEPGVDLERNAEVADSNMDHNSVVSHIIEEGLRSFWRHMNQAENRH